jgi:RNA polymerase sigma-70 factor (TIGR02960 family)
MQVVKEDLESRNRLARAQRGDEAAFAQLTEPYRRELQLHCYRILGSFQDAEDLLQETLLAAWRGLEQFEGRSSLRAWLYTIATNRCLNALRDERRRPQLVMSVDGPDSAEVPWLSPYPDALLGGIADASPGPAARYEAKEAVALTFVSGLQYLAPRQRAVLVLRDVLAFHADEVAEMLGSSVASVNSALQRARAVLETRLPPARDRLAMPLTGAEREFVDRFADAFQRDDIDGVVALLTDDAFVAMPPNPFWCAGGDAIGQFLRERIAIRGVPWRFVPIGANLQPAFAYYFLQDGEWVRHGMFVVGVRPDGIASVIRFGERRLLASLGVPQRIPAERR